MPESESARLRTAVLVSGGGSNLEAILKAAQSGRLPRLDVVLVISSRAGVGAMEHAHRYGVKTLVVERRAFDSENAFQSAMLNALVGAEIDLICLAGYLRQLGREIIAEFRDRILNIHPGLLPAHGGPGMYGHFVHEAVLAAGDKESGCTVHLVDEEYDHGPVLAQVRVPVKSSDNAVELAQRVLVEEHRLYPQAIANYSQRLEPKRYPSHHD